MNGKLARIEQQELSLVSPSDSCSSSPAAKENSNGTSDLLPNSTSEIRKREAKKKKKSKEVTLDETENIDSHEDLMVKKDKKKKKRKRAKDDEGSINYASREEQYTEEMENCTTGNKKRKTIQNETIEFTEVEENVADVNMENSSTKKRKKKKSKSGNDENIAATPDNLDFDSTDPLPHKNKKSKKRKKRTK